MQRLKATPSVGRSSLHLLRASAVMIAILCTVSLSASVAYAQSADANDPALRNAVVQYFREFLGRNPSDRDVSWHVNLGSVDRIREHIYNSPEAVNRRNRAGANDPALRNAVVQYFREFLGRGPSEPDISWHVNLGSVDRIREHIYNSPEAVNRRNHSSEECQAGRGGECRRRVVERLEDANNLVGDMFQAMELVCSSLRCPGFADSSLGRVLGFINRAGTIVNFEAIATYMVSWRDDLEALNQALAHYEKDAPQVRAAAARVCHSTRNVHRSLVHLVPGLEVLFPPPDCG